jgi:hypothetical protein
MSKKKKKKSDIVTYTALLNKFWCPKGFHNFSRRFSRGQRNQIPKSRAHQVPVYHPPLNPSRTFDGIAQSEGSSHLDFPNGCSHHTGDS